MQCPKLAEGQVVRVTRVDDCGNPVAGAGNGFVDSCWVRVQMDPNLIAPSDPVVFRTQSGAICGSRKGCSTLESYDVRGSFFSASPQLIELLTGAELAVAYDGSIAGWDDCALPCDGGFALEMWQTVLGSNCGVDDPPQFFYWLLPWITPGVLGDIEVAERGVKFNFKGTTRAGGAWLNGPYLVQGSNALDVPGPLVEPLGEDCHRRAIVTTIAPPTPTCSYVTVPPVHTSST